MDHRLHRSIGRAGAVGGLCGLIAHMPVGTLEAWLYMFAIVGALVVSGDI